MRHWLVRADARGQITEKISVVGHWTPRNRVRPQGGDTVFFVGRASDDSDWHIHRTAKVSEMQPSQRDRYSQYAELQLEGEIDEVPASIRAMWMSFSRADQSSIKSCCYGFVGSIAPISPNGARAIIERAEFPIGTTLWLLRKHLDEVADKILESLAFTHKERGLTQWLRALEVLERELQERVMLPAYWSTRSHKQWEKLARHMERQDGLETHAFQAPRGKSNAGPAKILREIPFLVAADLVAKWEVGPSDRGTIRSLVLENLVKETLAEQRDVDYVYRRRAPAFPGGLFDGL